MTAVTGVYNDVPNVDVHTHKTHKLTFMGKNHTQTDF